MNKLNIEVKLNCVECNKELMRFNQTQSVDNAINSFRFKIQI